MNKLENPDFERMTYSLCVAESRETRELIVALDASGEIRPAGLYQVILTRKRDGLLPAISIHFCIAPGEKEAIQQVEGMAFPEVNSIHGKPELEAQISATATRIPFHIRGWSDNAF